MSRQVVCFNTVEKVSTLCEFTDSFIDIYVSLLYCHVQCCTLGTRGFSRVRREFSVLAEGRNHERLFARVTIKTWQKPETALEKSLAPRVTVLWCRIGCGEYQPRRSPEGNAGEVWVEMYRRGEKCRLVRYPVQDKRPTRDLIQWPWFMLLRIQN